MTTRLLKFQRIGATLMLLAIPAFAGAGDYCLRHDGQLLGDPLTIEYRWPLDLDRPPELLERPADAAGLFDQSLSLSGAGSQPKCEGGGIVGALNCVTEMMSTSDGQPLTPIEAEAELAHETATDGENTALEAIETADMADAPGATGSDDDRQFVRYAYGSIKVVPIFINANPPIVRMAVVDTSVRADIAALQPNAARRIHSDLTRMSDYMKTWNSTLGGEDVQDLADGKSWQSL
jgi:hypothetical protein